MKPSEQVMNNWYLRQEIWSYFGYQCTECSQRMTSNIVRSRKLSICFNCFHKNWKLFFPIIRKL